MASGSAILPRKFKGPRQSWNVSSVPTPTCREPSRARKIANLRIEELETKIGAIKGQQEDMGKRWDELTASFADATSRSRSRWNPSISTASIGGRRKPCYGRRSDGLPVPGIRR